MSKFPFVSIVVAAYNAERTIGRCIESLMELDYPEYEIIVVDNNSQDRTSEVIKQYKVTYLLEKRKGWPAARNAGIAYSKAKYVANIDADCFATHDWLKNLMIAFDGNILGCVVGKTLVEKGKTLAQRYYASVNPFDIEDKINKTEFVPWGGGNNLMIRKAFLDAGGYDSERFKSGADTEFHYRLEKRLGYKTKYNPMALIYHEARGSVSEFFNVAAKYACDGFLRSRIQQIGNRQKYNFFAIKKIYLIMLHILGMIFRCLKALIGLDSWFRVVSNFFSIISLGGAIYGYSKGRVRYIWRKLYKDTLIKISRKRRIYNS